jgi:DNA polymerase alpha subunit B
VLLGPILDSSNRLLEDSTEAYHSLFMNQVRFIEDLGRSTLPNTRVLIVPSTKDLHHDACYPQACFRGDETFSSRKITFLPNPSQIRINDVIFALSSADVIKGLIETEVFRVDKSVPAGPKDRMKRLAGHLVSQQSLYPLFPCRVGDNVDTSLCAAYELQHTPDIIIVSSGMKYFAEDAGHGVVCVNPEQVVKGTSGGTFATITISPLKDDEITGDEHKPMADRKVAERTRVDIERI